MKIERHQGQPGESPRIRSASGAWVYDDGELHEFAERWFYAFDFNLAALDDIIEAEATTPARRRQLLAWRQRAIDMQRRGDADAAEGWVRFLRELALKHAIVAKVFPEAEQRLAYRARQRGKRKGKPASVEAVQKHGADRNKRIRQYHERLVKADDDDPIGQTAERFDLSRRQTSRIVNGK